MECRNSAYRRIFSVSRTRFVRTGQIFMLYAQKSLKILRGRSILSVYAQNEEIFVRGKLKMLSHAKCSAYRDKSASIRKKHNMSDWRRQGVG